MCERGLRARGALEEGALARPERPSRWTLPITALRVMPPSSPAIWLAERPSAQSFLSNSTRSSVHVISRLPSTRPGPDAAFPSAESDLAARQASRAGCTHAKELRELVCYDIS